mmetsp:Transcript_40336/g.45010  ORF Transcript_40336/g.45010 Transcript_40336/m.45010 type:complete len:208 (+) Transcript_40336:10-633(+)
MLIDSKICMKRKKVNRPTQTVMSTTITKDEADAATADTAIVDATGGEEEKEEEGSNNNMDTMKPLFETIKDDDNAMLSFADGFRDKVKILFEKFDVDDDGYLNYEELAALQQATGSDDDDNTELSKKMYVMVCQSLNCHPDTGLSLGGLKFTYASEGADIDIDYDKVFNKKEKKKKKRRKKKKKPEEKDADEDDKIYEVGVNGVDIS